MSDQRKIRYSGTRWTLLTGGRDAISVNSAIELQRCLQSFLPYVLETRPAQPDDINLSGHIVVIGTPTNNPIIEKLIKNLTIKMPEGDQGFTILSKNRFEGKDEKLLAIAGNTSAGVLHEIGRASCRERV